MAETEPHCVETKNYATLTYIPNPQHRDSSKQNIKSQWTISIEWEVCVFKDMNDYIAFLTQDAITIKWIFNVQYNALFKPHN